MRAAYQILAIPYRKREKLEFLVLHRADHDQWQFVAGGGEDDEKPMEAAMREIGEEISVKAEGIITLTSTTYIPASIISEKHRKNWPKDTFVIPEYAFAFECEDEPKLSGEHTEYEWLGYDAAASRLKWDSNRTALYELNCRLNAE